MIKRTPQEIADFFQGYVAMDMNEDWYLYPSKPKLDVLDEWWVNEEKSTINISEFVKIDETPDWKESLCKPVKRRDISSAIMQILMVASALSEVDHQTEEKKLMDENIHKIANHYGIKPQMQQLMEECAELSIEASHFIRGKDNAKALIEEMADVEIMLEQIKYLTGIKYKEIFDAQKAKVERQLKRIDEESADNPQIVREESTNGEEQKW